MASLNPIANKALSGKLGSMQILLLTAMTVFGFYLCFKEIRKLALDTASLRARIESVPVSGKPLSGPPVPPQAAAPQPADSPDPRFVDEEEEEDDGGNAMDAGLREMLSQLQGATAPSMAVVTEFVATPAPRASPPTNTTVEEVEEVEEAAAVKEAEAVKEVAAVKEEKSVADELMLRKREELEKMMDDRSLPHKKADNKSKLVAAILKADQEAAAKTDGALAEAVAADDE
nr:hypothetical protein TetV2_00187 [Oceanusvirus sp.]